MTEAYPETQPERTRWILAQRDERKRRRLDPAKPHGFLIEPERSESGRIVHVATVFLANRECPWRCLMCDLWKNTLIASVPRGAIPAQIDSALGKMKTDGPVEKGNGRRPNPPEAEAGPLAPRHIKLYNSGSFFDPVAIPPEDYSSIAARVRDFERVIVECHPALVGDRVLRFRDLLHAKNRETALEVAVGLETAHAQVLEKLNKGMTLDHFRQAAAFLRKNQIALRVFILVQPPFLDEAAALFWAKRSLDLAFDVGATAACLIPTRPGNGALEQLARHGRFAPPRLATLEAAAEYGIGAGRGRVFSDLWDLERFSDCPGCFVRRADRLRRMNLSQDIPDGIGCAVCGHGLNRPQD